MAHCTATSNFATVEAIQNYWRKVLGWKNPGYHYIIRDDGTYEQLASDEAITNGVKGHNADSLHIAYIGGENGKDTRSSEQKKTMYHLIRRAMVKYPQAQVFGHSDFAVKACPCFDVREWLENYSPEPTY